LRAASSKSCSCVSVSTVPPSFAEARPSKDSCSGIERHVQVKPNLSSGTTSRYTPLAPYSCAMARAVSDRRVLRRYRPRWGLDPQLLSQVPCRRFEAGKLIRHGRTSSRTWREWDARFSGEGASALVQTDRHADGSQGPMRARAVRTEGRFGIWTCVVSIPILSVTKT
jgi:hypothetical protein